MIDVFHSSDSSVFKSIIKCTNTNCVNIKKYIIVEQAIDNIEEKNNDKETTTGVFTF